HRTGANLELSNRSNMVNLRRLQQGSLRDREDILACGGPARSRGFDLSRLFPGGHIFLHCRIINHRKARRLYPAKANLARLREAYSGYRYGRLHRSAGRSETQNLRRYAEDSVAGQLSSRRVYGNGAAGCARGNGGGEKSVRNHGEGRRDSIERNIA